VKILHIVHWPKSGIVNLLYNILSEQREVSDIKNYALFFEEDSETMEKFSEVTEHTGALLYGVYTFRAMLALREQVRDVSPDIIHVHSFLPHLYSFLLKNKIPLVRTVHSDYPYFRSKNLSGFIKRSIEHYLLKRSREAISVSNSLAGELRNIFNNVCFKTILNGIYVRKKEGAREAILKNLGIPDGSLVYISVGRLEAQKGYDILVKAFSRSLMYSKDIYLLILGEGGEYEQLSNAVKYYSASENIRLLGYQNAPYEYLNASDIYISSARYEGLPLSVMEAQSMGLPVVGFDVTGVRDVVINGVTGVLERKVDEGVLEKLVNYSRENIDEVRVMGGAAEKRIKEKFTIQQTAKNYFDLYNKILNV